jgi:hypothetical protein
MSLSDFRFGNPVYLINKVRNSAVSPFYLKSAPNQYLKTIENEKEIGINVYRE